MPPITHGHGGGLDKTGGHHDRQNGVYHCHREPCLSNQKSTVEATREAERAGRSFSSLYNRKDWPHWIDTDGDCQNTRAEILISQSQVPVTFRNKRRCSVIKGQWFDPYSGKTWFKAADVDIDHLVPLAWAHIHGGSNWNKSKKRQFANDLENLIAVEDNLNQAKGSKSPDD